MSFDEAGRRRTSSFYATRSSILDYAGRSSEAEVFATLYMPALVSLCGTSHIFTLFILSRKLQVRLAYSNPYFAVALQVAISLSMALAYSLRLPFTPKVRLPLTILSYVLINLLASIGTFEIINWAANDIYYSPLIVLAISFISVNGYLAHSYANGETNKINNLGSIFPLLNGFLILRSAEEESKMPHANRILRYGLVYIIVIHLVTMCFLLVIHFRVNDDLVGISALSAPRIGAAAYRDLIKRNIFRHKKEPESQIRIDDDNETEPQRLLSGESHDSREYQDAKGHEKESYESFMPSEQPMPSTGSADSREAEAPLIISVDGSTVLRPNGLIYRVPYNIHKYRSLINILVMGGGFLASLISPGVLALSIVSQWGPLIWKVSEGFGLLVRSPPPYSSARVTLTSQLGICCVAVVGVLMCAIQGDGESVYGIPVWVFLVLGGVSSRTIFSIARAGGDPDVMKWDMTGRLLGSVGFLVMVGFRQTLFRPF